MPDELVAASRAPGARADVWPWFRRRRPENIDQARAFISRVPSELDHLGGELAGVLLRSHQVSMVFGLRLAGGRDVVVKARADDGLAASCLAAQARLAERGLPCARPLTPVVGVGRLAVHAEEYQPGGEVLHGDSPDMAVRCAEVFARLMAELAGVRVAPPLPNPPWRGSRRRRWWERRVGRSPVPGLLRTNLALG
jgi:hypothetical protein